jgi:hypothetical protein
MRCFITPVFRNVFRLSYVPEGKRKPRKLEFDMTHQLISLNNVHLFGDHVNTVEESAGVLSDAC